MNAICKIILVGPIALALWGCGEGAEQAHDQADGQDDALTTTTSTLSEPASVVEGTGAEPFGAGTQDSAAGDQDAASNQPGSEPDLDPAGELDGDEYADEGEFDLAKLATAESAIKFWIEKMGESDYYGVLFASDTGSSHYLDLQKWADVLEEAELHEDPQKRFAAQILKMAFNDPWIDAEIDAGEPNGPRVRFNVTWINGREVPIDVNGIDGVWRVLVTQEMLQPSRDTTDLESVFPPPSAPEDEPASDDEEG